MDERAIKVRVKSMLTPKRKLKSRKYRRMRVVNVAKMIAPIVGSRDFVNSLLMKIDKKDKVVLDFKNVEFLSRSAAHELLKYMNMNPNKIYLRNLSPSVRTMLELVESQSKKENEGQPTYELENHKVNTKWIDITQIM